MLVFRPDVHKIDFMSKKKAKEITAPQNSPTINEPKKIGRPSSYNPKYCEEIVEYMRQGFSKIAFAAHIGINVSSIYEWERNYPEFSVAIKVAEQECQKYWENMGNMGAMGMIPNFNATAWIFNMKNRFKWRDKQPEEVTQVNVNIEKMSDEELEKIIKEAAEKLK